MAYGFKDDKSKVGMPEVVYQRTYGTSENPTFGDAFLAVAQALTIELGKTYEITITSQFVNNVSFPNEKYNYRQSGLEIGRHKGHPDKLSLSDGLPLGHSVLLYGKSQVYTNTYSLNDSTGEVHSGDFNDRRIKQEVQGNREEVTVIVYAYDY